MNGNQTHESGSSRLGRPNLTHINHALNVSMRCSPGWTWPFGVSQGLSLGTARRCALPVRRRRWRAVSPDKATTRQRATPSSEFVSAAARIIVPLAGASSPRPPPYMRARRERPRPAPHADADHGRLVWSQRLHGAEGSVPEPSQSRASSFVTPLTGDCAMASAASSGIRTHGEPRHHLRMFHGNRVSR